VIRCRLRYLLAQKSEAERRKKPYTQRQLSELTGLSTNIINRYINDDFERIDKSTVDAFCRFLGCGVGDLLEYEETEEAG
jgi:DNA-binding Xre family transcriptional regulator